jgi:hypothetical protein
MVERSVWSAAIAQLVEHVIRNDGVTGSSPVCGTSLFDHLEHLAGSPTNPRVCTVSANQLRGQKGAVMNWRMRGLCRRAAVSAGPDSFVLGLAAGAALMLCSRGGHAMLARIGVMRALNRNVERAFNPDAKKHHWGKHKPKDE